MGFYKQTFVFEKLLNLVMEKAGEHFPSEKIPPQSQLSSQLLNTKTCLSSNKWGQQSK